jgi:CubicO group peptidase (beta-lactamase class C family)
MCREATSVQSSGWDVFVERDVDWGLGLQLENGQFGHGGLGGSGGYADSSLQIAVGYVTNRMSDTDRSGPPEMAAEAAAAALGDRY